MRSPQTLPEGLANMPPGPGLAALLATVDRSLLGGSDVVLLLKARARQVAHDQAQLLADVLEVGHLPWDTTDGVVSRMSTVDEFSTDQIAFALTWSRWAAGGHLALAEDLLRRLPMVFEALTAGRIDLPRARVFSDTLALVDDEVAAAIATHLLAKAKAKAETWTCGRLRERLRYQVLKLVQCLTFGFSLVRG